MKPERARLGVSVSLDLPSANAGRVLALLGARGGRARAFDLARALSAEVGLQVSLSALAPTLAWLEGHRLAEASGSGWRVTTRGQNRLRWLPLLRAIAERGPLPAGSDDEGTDRRMRAAARAGLVAPAGEAPSGRTVWALTPEGLAVLETLDAPPAEERKGA
ncbi:MAG TPA: hypothetical protein VFS43_09685 [Polyangiaceae bacterium]|nr:hypothetical protein [Polyangiaceae bacterium]